MRRIIPMLALFAAGCSTAPIADFMDAVAPGGPPRGRTAERPRDPLPPAPPLAPKNTDPPLPPVPADGPSARHAPQPGF